MHKAALATSQPSVCHAKQEWDETEDSSKILNFIREMVLKIAKIQTFALVYLHIINKTAVEARHTPSQSFHRCPSISLSE